MDVSDLPPPGHNAPPAPKPLSPEQIREWLGMEYSSLTARGGEIAQALKAAIEAAPVIDTEEQLLAFADNVRMAKAWQRTAEERRKDAKAPFLEGGRDIDAWFREIGAGLTRPLDACQKAMDAFQAKVAAAARKAAEEAARKAREEAERAAEQAAAAAREAAKQGASLFGGDDQAVADRLAAAQRAAGRADKAEALAEGSVATHVRSHSDFGTVATAREFIEFDVTDETIIPRALLSLDESKVRLWLRENVATQEQKATFRKALEAGRQPFKGIAFRIVTRAMVR